MNELRIREADLFRGAPISIEKGWLDTIKALIEGREEIRLEEKYLQNAEVQGRGDKIGSVEVIQADRTGKRTESVGILNITGTLIYSGPEWLEFFGYGIYQSISRRFDMLMADSRIKTIILRVQSPGGSISGCGELAKKIFDARKDKKIVAYADPYAYSAAYWLATSASSLYTMPSGMVGSIGVYTTHEDISEMMKAEGIKVTFIKAGEKKVDGNSFEPLSDRARADLQAQVDEFYENFVGDVARNRGVSVDDVKGSFGQGGTVTAKEAVQMGMIDGIYSFDEVVNMELTAISEDITLAAGRVYLQREMDFLNLED